EEQQILLGNIAAIDQAEKKTLLSVLFADVLQNPALKANRDLYGTPGDKRFAVVDSEGMAFLKGFQAEIAGYQQVLPERMGKRLLGIRLDKYQDDKDGYTFTVSLLNA